MTTWQRMVTGHHADGCGACIWEPRDDGRVPSSVGAKELCILSGLFPSKLPTVLSGGCVVC